MWGGLVAVGMICVHPSFLSAAAIFICVLLLSLLWLRSFKVIISDSGISKNMLFERPNMITWSEIRDAEIRVDYSGRYEFRDSLRSPYRLVIEPHSSANSRPLVINLKLLSHDDANCLVQILNSKLPGTNLKL
jgi:hypothetical protein